MSLTQTGGAAGWLVGAHRQVAAPKDAVTRATSRLKLPTHSTWGYMFFLTKSQSYKNFEFLERKIS